MFSCSVNNSFHLSACLFNRSKIVVGVLNVVLALSVSVSLSLTIMKVGSNEFIHKAPTLTGQYSTVSTNTHTSHLSGDACIHRLQTALHSVLSTRVMLHTATVLRQDLIDSQATVTQNQCSNGIRFAEVTMELVSEDVELEETQR